MFEIDFTKVAVANPIQDCEMLLDMIDDGISSQDIERWIGEGHKINELYARWVNLELMPD